VIAQHAFWITSRAAGIAALLASTAAVALGLLMSTRLRRSADFKPLHEALSLTTMGTLAVHALALLGDSYLKPSLADVTLPFVSGYMRLWTTLGIVAGWMMILLGLAYYVRGRIGPARWRSLHRFTALAWALALVHTLGEGTDAGAAWFVLPTLALALPTAALLLRRVAPA
jgi:sulfoxide reductase heme-binding subunit YedZ